MAKRTSTPMLPQTSLQLLVGRREAEDALTVQRTKGAWIRKMPAHHTRDFEKVLAERERWLADTEQLLQRQFSNDSIVTAFKQSLPSPLGGYSNFTERHKVFQTDMDEYDNRLRTIIETLEVVLVRPGSPSSVQSAPLAPSTDVFIVHGHDETARESVARFVTKLGLNPIILHEQANKGRTIIDKFTQNASVGFAVVLLTPDDYGGTIDSPRTPQPRARQNVILELGFFGGKLGWDRVCALKRGEMELPSDYSGVVYVDLDSAGAWKLTLAKEMKAAGLPVDLNKLAV